MPTGCARIVGNLSGNGFGFYNANNVIVENLALTGNVGPIGIGIDAATVPLGGSDSVTIQNNYVYNFGGSGGGIITNRDKAFSLLTIVTAGHITNCLIQDNYVTAPGVNGSGVGPGSSPDGGILHGAWNNLHCTRQSDRKCWRQYQQFSGQRIGYAELAESGRLNDAQTSSNSTLRTITAATTRKHVGGPYSIYCD